MLCCTPSPEEVASLPSRGRGSRNSGERMEPAGPCLASAFWPGKHSRSRELLPTQKKRKGWAKGPWHRAALQAQQAAASSAAGCQPRGWHFGRGLGRPFGHGGRRGYSSLLDLNHEATTPLLAITQHTPAAPNIWHGQAAASEGRQHPTTNPAQGAGGCSSPAAPSRKWGNSKTIIIIITVMIIITTTLITIIIKKNVNDPAPCPVAPGHPREQGMLQAEGRWRHKDFPANTGSRLYCTLHHIYFYIYIYKNTN